MRKPDPPGKIAQRPLFAGHFTTIVTMVGISVGLGNVWRFPYMMGSYGGSAFLIVYLLLTVAFAIPAVMAEWGLGRATRHGPIGAFRAALGRRAGVVVGLMMMITILMAESYYLYVVANVAYSVGFSTFLGFAPEHIDRFQFNLSLAPLQYGTCLLLLAASYIVLRRGLNRGIASLSKIFVPFFLITMLLLIVFALRLENAAERLLQFLKPDFSQLGPESIFAALGDVLAAVMAGLFIVPTARKPLPVRTADGDVHLQHRGTRSLPQWTERLDGGPCFPATAHRRDLPSRGDDHHSHRALPIDHRAARSDLRFGHAGARKHTRVVGAELGPWQDQGAAGRVRLRAFWLASALLYLGQMGGPCCPFVRTQRLRYFSAIMARRRPHE
jgi:hypothetical protein